MESKKLIFTDFDGVLLNDAKYISSETLQAIYEFKNITDSNNDIIIMTGRSYRPIENFYKLLKLSTPVIICNGAAIYMPNTNEYIYENFFNKRQCRHFYKNVFIKIKKLINNEIELSWDYKNELILWFKYDWFENLFKKEKGIKSVNENIDSFTGAYKITISIKKADYEKNQDDIDKILKKYIYYSWENKEKIVFDIFKKDVSKYKAFKKLIYLKRIYKKYDHYFIIEGENDNCFLNKKLKNIYTLKNSNDLIQEEAREKTHVIDKTNNEEGFKHFINKIQNNNLTKNGNHDQISKNKYIIFFDICSFSTVTNENELKIIRQVTNIMIELLNNNYAFLKYKINHTGDGFVVCFDINSLMQDLDIFNFLIDFLILYNKKTELNQYTYKISLNWGSVYEYIDTIGEINFAGNGINDAQRIMSFGYQNHILISHTFWKSIANLDEIKSAYCAISFQGYDKHGIPHYFYNVFNKKNIGILSKVITYGYRKSENSEPITSLTHLQNYVHDCIFPGNYL
jgi:hypothetical protein